MSVHFHPEGTKPHSQVRHGRPRFTAQKCQGDTCEIQPAAPLPFDGLAQATCRNDDVRLTKLFNGLRAGDLNTLKHCLNARHQDHTLLMLAAQQGHTAVGKTLLRQGCNPSLGLVLPPNRTSASRVPQPELYGAPRSTPMYLAARAGHADFVTLLLDAGVPTDDILCAMHTEVSADVLEATKKRGMVTKKQLLPVFEHHIGCLDGFAHAEKILQVFSKPKEIRFFANPHSMVLAAKNLCPKNIDLVRQHGVSAAVPWRAPRSHSRQSDKIYPLQAAIDAALDSAHQPFCERLMETLHHLVAADAHFDVRHIRRLALLKETAPLLFAIAHSDRMKPEGLCTLAEEGHLRFVAMLLEKYAFDPQDVARAAQSAHRAGYAETLNLLQTKYALLTHQKQANSFQAKAQWHVRRWERTLLSPVKATPTHRLRPLRVLSALERAEEAQARYDNLLIAAAQIQSRERRDSALPRPTTSFQR